MDGGESGPGALLRHLPEKVLELEGRGALTRTFRRLDPERQMEVLVAVLAEAASTGPREVNVRAIARRAGVAVGSLYQYFGDRRSMVAVAAEIASGLLVADLLQYRDEVAALPLREALVAYVCAGVEWSQSQAELLRFFAGAAYQGDVWLGGRIVAPVVDALLGMVRAILVAARARGEIASGVDLETAARYVHALTLTLGDSYLLPHLDVYFRQLDGATLAERATTLAEFVTIALQSGETDASSGEE